MTDASYDEIANWYETEFLAHQRRGAAEWDFADLIGVDQAILELLGPGTGPCLEVGCGTGIYADRVQSLGRAPIGLDLSPGMLGYAKDRLPVACGDAARLPFPSNSFDSALAVMVHSDMPDYPRVLSNVHRVLKPGGSFLHIGVHPCFIGSFATRTGDGTDDSTVTIRPGYLDTEWTPPIDPTAGTVGTSGQVRDKIGAAHYPLAELINEIVGAGFQIDQAMEGGAPTPITFSLLTTARP